MKPEHLLDAIGQADEELLSRAEKGAARHAKRRIALAAMLCLAVGIGVFALLKLPAVVPPNPTAPAESTPSASGEDPLPTEPTGEEPTSTEPTGDALRVALIAGDFSAGDHAMCQSIREGIDDYCAGMDYADYQPTGDSTYERMNAMEQAVSDGYNVLILPGWGYADAIVELQARYPEVCFVGLDMYGEEAPLAENACILNFNETVAGYLAGYAAVAEGYEQLGFLGDTAVPQMIRYGYGFMQGADAAAADFARENVCLRYTYCNSFSAEDTAKLTAKDWFGSGTQVVLACTDATAAAAAEVAAATGNRLIGTDYSISAAQEQGEDVSLTSAVKDYAAAVRYVLTAIESGAWAELGGKTTELDESFVGLPTDEWRFTNFTREDYETLLSDLRAGKRVVSSDLDAAPEVNIEVQYE
ncbi:MAG: BMP family protein [Faecousia sp.]